VGRGLLTAIVGSPEEAYRLQNVLVSRPAIFLLVSLVGMLWFSRGFRVLDSLALLVCGLIAGGALAALAAARRKSR
jgi:hypothetical protein